MSTKSDKALCLRHYQEALSAKRLEVVDEIYADQVRIGDGGTMVTRSSAEGTHLGDFMDTQPQDRK